VGEPTGARPNMYGDNAPLILPNSRIQIRLSTLWWQDMDPRDLRPHQAPDLAADLTMEEYRDGRDPALEVIRNYDPRKSPQQTIRAALSRRDWGEAKKVMLANKANPLFRYTSFERSVNSLGYELLSKRSFDDAIEVFKLNVEVYPDSSNAYDSLAQAYAARHDVSREDLRLAEENYRKSLRLNPGNTRATAELEGLKQR